MITVNTTTLRGVTESDLPFIVATRHNIEIELAAHATPPTPRPVDVYRRRLEAGHQAVSSGADASIEFIVCSNAEPKVPIGIAGLYGIDHHNGIAEMGVTIGNPEYWGTGAGFDAHLAVLNYGFDICRLHRVYGQVKSDNAGVIRLCERLGMRHEGTLRRHRWKNGTYVDLVVFGILNDEYDRSLARWREQRRSGSTKKSGSVSP